MKKTNGLYPAPLEAIDVMVDGLGYDRKGSLELERGAFERLLKTDVAENLVGVFFLQERSKKTKGEKGYKVGKSAVIGAGVMGAGIAQWVSSRGIPTILKDIKPEFVANGMKTIGMNHKVLEQEFIEENSHCHLCSAAATVACY